MTVEWDAATYDRISDPQVRWGAAVLDRLPLEGGERVMDAGCGSGRVTALLLERLPFGSVVAVDVSTQMIEQARQALGRDPRVQFVLADLARPIPAAEPVDAVFSNAVFHWVPNHDALFASLAAVMRPGARLVAQCGGEGNISRVMKAARDAGDDWDGPVYFASVEATRHRLEAAGFEDIDVWTHQEPTRFEPGRPFETFLATVVLRAHIARMPWERRAAFVHGVAAGLPEPVIDYVRLNIVARRGWSRTP
jgi:trans-aconitate 2-methyltransferase